MMDRIVPIICALLAIGIFFVYINPTYTGKVADLSNQIKSYDSALAAAKQFSQEENQLAAARASIPNDAIDRLTAYLPDSVNNVQLILDLQALGARSGITLSNFDVQSSKDQQGGTASSGSSGNIPLSAGAPVDSLLVSLAASGSYETLKTFLSAMEHSLRPLDLTDLTIGAGSVPGQYTYNMTFRLYWLR